MKKPPQNRAILNPPADQNPPSNASAAVVAKSEGPATDTPSATPAPNGEEPPSGDAPTPTICEDCGALAVGKMADDVLRCFSCGDKFLGRGAAIITDPALRTDGPTIEEYVAAGYPAENYPPHGYAVRLATSAPIFVRVVAQAVGEGGVCHERNAVFATTAARRAALGPLVEEVRPIGEVPAPAE